VTEIVIFFTRIWVSGMGWGCCSSLL